LAGQHRPDSHFFKTGALNFLYLFLIDLFIGLNQEFSGDRVVNVFEGHSSEHAIPDPLDNLAPFYEGRGGDPVHGPAILFGNHRILSHVHKPSSQIPGVRGFEGRVGQSLSSSVGGDKVLEDGQPFSELEVMGVSMISPEGFAINPLIPASCRIWSLLPLAPESAIMRSG